jgi:hypothetical protein
MNQLKDTDKTAVSTMKTDDGLIKGTVKYNTHWKKFQVYIDGSLYGEFNSLSDGIEELKNSGFEKIKIVTDSNTKMESVKQKLRPIIESIVSDYYKRIKK